MLRDKWFMITSGPFEGGKILGGADISQSHADVAQKTAPLDPLDGRFAK